MSVFIKLKDGRTVEITDTQFAALKQLISYYVEANIEKPNKYECEKLIELNEKLK